MSEKYSYLLVGSAGTGKTIFSLQWLLEGRRRGEKGLYLTLAEPEEKIEQNVAGFGWTLEGVDLADLTIKGEQLSESAGEYHIFPPSEVGHTPVWEGIYEAVRSKRPQRLVIDSLTQLRFLSTDDYQFRKLMLALVTFLNQSGCTTLLAFESTELEREASVALAVDGIIRLRMQVSPGRVIGLRSLQVEKLRGSDFMSGLHPLRITGEGIRLFPHRVEKTGRTSPGREKFSFGNKELDELLGGGSESGTATKLILESCGAEVAAAGSGGEGLELLKSFRPDVLVSDIGMPGEDGYALIEKVRALPPESGGRVPALALTAYARAEDRLRVVRAGYQMHVTKPVEPAELVAVVDSPAGRAQKA